MENNFIYCVEDDDNIRELVVYTLESTGFRAQGFEDGGGLFAALSGRLPALILLDIMLPGEDGMSILSRLKESPDTRAIPVILVTAKGAEYDKVIGLDSGADDYVSKPFGMMELVSRVRAVLRRSGGAKADGGQEISVGAISMDTGRHEVKSGDQVVSLTFKEYELLKRLMLNPGIVLTRDRLLQEIWGYDFDGETRTVDVHVRTLRQKLMEAGEQIETVRGVGYRMAGQERFHA